jgi:3-hydroxyisobutyrate dehydrogenase-like beta-hydroxyacid dehydrogenase
MRVGFCGLGKMGQGIARNLLLKGFPVTVVAHRNRAPVDELVARGAAEAATLADAARDADVVILCVSDTPAVESAIYGANGILSAARAGLIVIDCTTSEPQSTARIAADLAARGATFVDAPVARSPKDAEEGRLNTMVGADADTFRKITPFLKAYCENIFHAGPSGAGHKTKLIYNFLTIGQIALVAEALSAARRAGLDLPEFCKVVGAGAANSTIFQLISQPALAGTFDGFDFALDLAKKDVAYYTYLAEQLGMPALVGQAVHQSLAVASANGFGHQRVGALVSAHETRAARDR